jgi:hypothetical protein
MNHEAVEWCALRISQQPKRRPSWTPFIIQTIGQYAAEKQRPDIEAHKKLWADFQHGVVPTPKLEVIQ